MGRGRERDGEGHHSRRSRSRDTRKSSNKKVRNDRRPTVDPRPPRGVTPSASPGSPRSSSSRSTGASESLLGECDPPRSRKRKRRHEGGRAAEDDAASSSGGRGGSAVTEKRKTSKTRKKARRMTDVPDKKREKKRQKKRDGEDGKRRGVGEGKVKKAKHSKRRREKAKLLMLSSSSRAQTVPGGSSTSNNDTDGSARAGERTLDRRPSTEGALGTVSHRARSRPPAVEIGTDRAASLPPPSEPAGSSQGSLAASSREARAKAMVPMRPEEYTAQQKVIREVFDEDTGRWRLVRGTGEIIERIVSRREQHAIQQHASRWGWDHKALSGAAVVPSDSSLGGR